MAQTTNAISFRAGRVEISINGTVWTDISGFSASITVDGGERETEDTQTFDGDTPILTAGKRGSLEVKVKIVYTEGVSDPQEVVRTAYEAASALYVRWYPKGSTSGNFLYTTDPGIVKNHPYPGGEAESAAAVATGFTLATAKVTKSVAA